MVDDLISFRGTMYLLITGVIGIQFMIIKDQSKIIDKNERNTAKLESLLKDLLEREDISEDIKRLIKNILEKVE